MKDLYSGYPFFHVYSLPSLTFSLSLSLQSYTTNSAKVIFLHQRPQTRNFKGSGKFCSTCDRSLQDPYLFCSLSCKVSFALKPEILSLMLSQFFHIPISIFSRLGLPQFSKYNHFNLSLFLTWVCLVSHYFFLARSTMAAFPSFHFFFFFLVWVSQFSNTHFNSSPFLI